MPWYLSPATWVKKKLNWFLNEVVSHPLIGGTNQYFTKRYSFTKLSNSEMPIWEGGRDLWTNNSVKGVFSLKGQGYAHSGQRRGNKEFGEGCIKVLADTVCQS